MKTDVILLKPASLLTKTDNLDSRELIKEYLMAGGVGVELSDKNKEVLERWEFADEKIREHTGKLSRSEIANLIKNKFNCSIATAKADMVAAEYVFSSSNPLNKSHRISLRIEFLEKQIRLAAAANDYKAVGMMEKTLAKYIEMYPEITPVEVPKNLIFSFDVTKLIDRLMQNSDADEVINAQLEKNKLLDSMSEDIEEELEGDIDHE
jgi:hypothetical protein